MSVTFRDQRQQARLDALARRVAAILEHLGVADPVPVAPPGVSARVVELARASHTMHAIQAQMKETGDDFKTASEAVAEVGAD